MRGFAEFSINLISLATEAELTAFMNFKITFNRKYSSEAAEISALLVFVKNLRIINIQNQKFIGHTSGYKDGVSSLTDIEHDLFISTHTGYIATVQARLIQNVEFPPTKIPEHLNYVDEGLVTRVMYQGFCGGTNLLCGLMLF